MDVIEVHTKKMVKKMLQLCLHEQSILLINAPSYLQLASIMGERTADERQQFGKVKTEGVQISDQSIDWLID